MNCAALVELANPQKGFKGTSWVTSGHTPVRQNHGHDAILHSNTGYRNA